MRIDPINTTVQSTDIKITLPVKTDRMKTDVVEQQNKLDVVDIGTKDKLQQAINSMNEFFTINNSELKFVLHEGLGKYFAQLVNLETEEVIREIPSKKMLDVFYEMQKLVGMIVDKKI